MLKNARFFAKNGPKDWENRKDQDWRGDKHLELEKFCKMSFWLQKSALIQPRTSRFSVGYSYFNFQCSIVLSCSILPLAVGLLVGAQALGSLISSLPCAVGATLARCGRRRVFAASGLAVAVAVAVQATARSWEQVVVGRFALGLPIGVLCVAPMYAAEAA